MGRTDARRFAVAIVGLGLSAPPAFAEGGRPAVSSDTADPKEVAKQRFVEAKAAYESGDHARAATLFEEAFRIAPHGSVKLNAAIAWDHAGVAARAADGYETALAMGGFEPREGEEARARLAKLNEELGQLRVTEPVGATVRVAHVEAAAIPVRVHVDPGVHLVHVAEGSWTAEKRIEVAAGQSIAVVFDRPPPEPEPASVHTQGPSTAAAVSPSADDREPSGSSQATWGFIALGGGAVLSGVAIALGLSALDARDDFEASGRTDAEAHDRAANQRTWTNVAWGGALLSGGVGAYLVLTSPVVEF